MSNSLLTAAKLEALLDRNKPVIIGLSGGLDSMVLFDVLKQHGYILIAAHVNHQKRSESNHEEAFIEKYVTKQGMRIETLRHTFKTDAAFQAEARTVRNNFFKRCAKKYGTDQVVLAHHEDDLIETFFMRLVKGSPLLNLISMSARHVLDEVMIVRPMLSLSKARLLAYAKANDIPYFEDSSNQLDLYTRNRFRQQLLPWLREENPSIGAAVALYTETLSDLDTLINTLANQYLAQENNAAVSVKTFALLNPLVAEMVLKKILEKNSAEPINLSKALLKRLLETLTPNQSNLTIPINDAWTLHLEYGYFFISQNSLQAPWCITVTQFGSYLAPNGQTYVFSDHKIAHMNGKYGELCYNCTVFPLYLRTRRAGDTMRCDYGHKKVSRLLIDEKVPPSVRDQLALLANEQTVLWIPFLNKTCRCEHEAAHDKIYVYEVDAC